MGAGVWHFALPDCVRILFDKIDVRESHRDIFSQKNQILIKKCRSKAQHLPIKDQRKFIESVVNCDKKNNQKYSDEEVKFYIGPTFDYVLMKYFIHWMRSKIQKFVLYECLAYLKVAIFEKEKLIFLDMKPTYPKRNLDDVAHFMKISKIPGISDEIIEFMVDGFNNCDIDDRDLNMYRDITRLPAAMKVNTIIEPEVAFFRSWLVNTRFPKYFACMPYLKLSSFIDRKYVTVVLPNAKSYAHRMYRKNRKCKYELAECFRILEMSLNNTKSSLWLRKRAIRYRKAVSKNEPANVRSFPTVPPALRIEHETLKEVCEEVLLGQKRQLSQTDLLFQSRDAVAMTELKNGNLALHVVSCNPLRYDRLQMRYLLEAFQIFQLSLTNMPAKYMARLVFDPRHRCLCLVKTATNTVCGAICFRPFPEQNFSEIVFCAVSSDEQVKGYGTFLMNHLKDYHISKRIFNLLTYADENAVGYFRKQGFTSEINMDKAAYTDFIKSYDGATLMQCSLDNRISYSHLSTILKFQTDVVDQIKKRQSQPSIFNGLTAPVRNSSDIPGVGSKS